MNSQTTDIANGFYKTLDELIKAGRVEVVAEQAADHSSDKATALAEDWITAFEDINCIVADSDEMALAAMNAYRRFESWHLHDASGDQPCESDERL